MLTMNLFPLIAGILTVLLFLVKHKRILASSVASVKSFNISRLQISKRSSSVGSVFSSIMQPIATVCQKSTLTDIGFTCCSKPKYKRDPDNEDTDQYPSD